MIAKALSMQLGFCRHVFEENTRGVDHEESLIAPGPGGNSMNWVLGHVVWSRDAACALLGAARLWPAERQALYGRGAPPLDPAAALPWERIVADYAASSDRVLGALEATRDADLERETRGLFVERSTVGLELAGLVFHESYHLGQLGVLRRVAGKAGALT